MISAIFEYVILAGSFTFTVVKEALTLALPHRSCAPMQACILCKLAWRSLSLATTTTSSICSSRAARCAQRPRPLQPALHLLPRYMCRSAAIHTVSMLGLALDPCLHACSLCCLRALAWRPGRVRQRPISSTCFWRGLQFGRS